MSQRETPCNRMSWKCFGRNLFENHLGVALIQPGDSVIVVNERFCEWSNWQQYSVVMVANVQNNKGGTA